MSDVDHLTLYVRFSGFKVVTLANRLGCDNDLARWAHDHLVEKLCYLINLMRRGQAAERRLLLDETCEDLYWIDGEFEGRWLSNAPFSLLDDLYIDVETNEIYDERSRCWRFRDADGPSLRDVSDAELCGLRRILDEIAAETSVSFSACRIVYGETDVVPSA